MSSTVNSIKVRIHHRKWLINCIHAVLTAMLMLGVPMRACERFMNMVLPFAVKVTVD
jgi:hypothetical protein